MTGTENIVKPNLFIIGAAKCGTTSLHAHLGSHPDIFMSEPKEPSFFVPENRHYPKDMDWYLGLFAAAKAERIVGESSTDYTKRPMFDGVPQRIASFAPKARFIYLMRDPIRRAISHYWQNARQFAEHLPMLEAIQTNPKYKRTGDYAFQLEPYFQLFERDRFLFLTFESFIADPVGVVNEVFTWLGVDPIAGDLPLEAENVTPKVVVKSRGRGHLNRFRYSGVWSRLSPRVPGVLKTFAKQWALEERKPKEEDDQPTVEFLLPWARERVAAIEDLLGREFPEWPLSRGETGPETGG